MALGVVKWFRVPDGPENGAREEAVYDAEFAAEIEGQVVELYLQERERLVLEGHAVADAHEMAVRGGGSVSADQWRNAVEHLTRRN